MLGNGAKTSYIETLRQRFGNMASLSKKNVSTSDPYISSCSSDMSTSFSVMMGLKRAMGPVEQNLGLLVSGSADDFQTFSAKFRSYAQNGGSLSLYEKMSEKARVYYQDLYDSARPQAGPHSISELSSDLLMDFCRLAHGLTDIPIEIFWRSK